MSFEWHLVRVIRELGNQVRRQAATIRLKNIEIEEKNAKIAKLEGR